MVNKACKDGVRSVSKMKKTEIGVIPEDWEVKELQEIGFFSKGKGISKSEANSGDIPAIRYGELYTKHHNVIKKIYSFINKDVAVNSVRLRTGDLLFAGSGETKEEIGKSAVFIDDFEAYVGGDIVVFKSNQNYSPIYLGYLSNASFIQKQKAANGQGDAVVHIYANNLRGIKIPLPPLAEQEAIAEALSDADAWIDSLEQLIAKKRLIKQGAMQTLLTPKDDWEVKKLGEVCDYKNGKSLENKVSDTGEYNIISLNSIDISGKLKKEHHKTNFNDNSLKKGDIVMVLSDVAHGNFLGLCDIIPDDNYVLNQRMGGLFNFRNIHVPFVRLQINYNQKYFKFSGKGSSQLNLGKPDILNFDIKFPSLSEQERIATILSDMDAELEALEAQLGKARQIKQGMMQELLTGRTRLIDN